MPTPPAAEQDVARSAARVSGLVRQMDEARTGLTAVLREVRRLEKQLRGCGGASAIGEEAVRLRELRVRESQLHRELGRLRGELERARAEAMGDA